MNHRRNHHKLFSVWILSMAASSSTFASLVTENEITGSAQNNAPVSAQLLQYNDFSPANDVTIFGTLPTATIYGNTGAQDVDFYSFRSGVGTAQFDIDGTRAQTDTALALFDMAGTLLAFSDDSDTPDPGSVDTKDAFLGTYTIANAGQYLLAVSSALNFPNALLSAADFTDLLRFDGAFGGNAIGASTLGDASYFTSGLQEDMPYTLHVSLSNPVPEPYSFALLGLGLLAMSRQLLQRRENV